MKIKRLLFLISIFILIFTFSSCSNTKVHYEMKDYILELDYKPNFRILQLTDIHIANKDDRQRQYDFLDDTIKKANADMIIVTGDLFTFADRKVAKELFAFLDSYKLPWTVTFGNHDEQCYFSIDWLTGYLNKLSNSSDSYCHFIDLQDDDVFGNANFAINLMEDGKIKEQLIIMDSNRYNYGEYIGYDYIKEDQIQWYENLVDYTTNINNGKIVDSVLFFHIPLPEWQEAWDKYQSGDSTVEYLMGTLNENVSCPKKNLGFFDRIVKKQSTNAILVGHDHVNDFILKYQGIYLCYGVNSTDRIYLDDNMLGGLVLTINEDNSLNFEQILKTYNDYE